MENRLRMTDVLFNDEKQIDALQEFVVEMIGEIQLVMNLWDNQDVRGAVIMLHKIQATVEDFAAKELPEIDESKKNELLKKAYEKVGYKYEE